MGRRELLGLLVGIATIGILVLLLACSRAPAASPPPCRPITVMFELYREALVDIRALHVPVDLVAISGDRWVRRFVDAAGGRGVKADWLLALITPGEVMVAAVAGDQACGQRKFSRKAFEELIWRIRDTSI